MPINICVLLTLEIPVTSEVPRGKKRPDVSFTVDSVDRYLFCPRPDHEMHFCVVPMEIVHNKLINTSKGRSEIHDRQF